MNVAQLTRWTSQLEVPWSTFIETLCMHLQLALPPNYDVLTPETSAIHCVKELVCVNDHVTAAKFGRLIGCFAPLDGLFLHRVRRHRGVFVALRAFYHSLRVGADSMADVTSMVSWRLADAAGGELAPLTSTVSSRKRDGIT